MRRSLVMTVSALIATLAGVAAQAQTDPPGASGGDWVRDAILGTVAPSLARLRGDPPGTDETPAIVLARLELDDPLLDAIPEVACWRETPHECPTYMVAAPDAALAAVTAPATGSLSVVGTGGVCQPTVEPPQLVAYVRGCESYFVLAAPLTGCPGPLAPVYLTSTGLPTDLTWIPALDGPIEEPFGPSVPSDPLHHEVLAAWLAANPLPTAPLIETRAMRRTANAGLESIESFFAGVNIHHNEDECSNEPRSLGPTGLRTPQGDWYPFTEGGLMAGVLASEGHAAVVAFDDGGYVRAWRRTGPTSFEQSFEGSYFDENDECEWWGSPVDFPYPCGP